MTSKSQIVGMQINLAIPCFFAYFSLIDFFPSEVRQMELIFSKYGEGVAVGTCAGADFGGKQTSETGS